MKDRLKGALKEAMKSKDKIRLDTLRAILTAFQYEEIAKGVEDLANEAQIAILKKELKKREEEIEFATKAGREEIVTARTAEMKVIEELLPQQLSRDQLTDIVKTIVAENSSANMGNIMSVLKQKHSGLFDGKIASEVVKQVLGN